MKYLLGVFALVVSSFSFAGCPQFLDVEDAKGRKFSLNVCQIGRIQKNPFEDNYFMAQLDRFSPKEIARIIPYINTTGECKQFITMIDVNGDIGVVDLCKLKLFSKDKIQNGNFTIGTVEIKNIEPLLPYLPKAPPPIDLSKPFATNE